ncbi:ATPase with strong ADP affinity [Georgfuchsia toluolica]|uniref:tRNA threonylcarbamoyladenosine biosynthesis protein TsaE n=1 Tax=Georgfuchsia toluolica TaxID=424218 RepID=A0A916J3U9_9PROT|nr:tRNA (adenosine(37)-N6)-threonylcarbamoyltransferase complex ATPase subunit type 1 TsaE [Georgfuchsia toluolica]CAG4883488.1 ATPase with strong ADP affinity [Georgfuchsia toluolica]
MPDHKSISLALANEAATLALGAQLGKVLVPGLRVFLEGDLGAGKTTLVRGLLRGLGYADKVKSPTYTLVEEYSVSGLDLFHFDFYRFTRAEEYLDAGLDEYFTGDGICLVEWPRNATPYLPPADIVVSLAVAGEARIATIVARSDRGEACLTSFPAPDAMR